MDRVVKITPAEALAHGLPAARIEFDLAGVPLVPHTFPDARTYVSMSGPPGGPLFFSIHPLSHSIKNVAALEELVRELYGKDKFFSLGKQSELKVQGSFYRAQLFFTGTSHAASANIALIVPSLNSNAPCPGLLFHFGHGGTPQNVADAASVARHEPLRRVLETIKWEIAGIAKS